MRKSNVTIMVDELSTHVDIVNFDGYKFDTLHFRVHENGTKVGLTGLSVVGDNGWCGISFVPKTEIDKLENQAIQALKYFKNKMAGSDVVIKWDRY